MWHRILLFSMLALVCNLAFAAPVVDISRDEAVRIGIKIWHNECGGKISGLTSWNDGEKFASLGIGHFIWSPSTDSSFANEGFVQLIRYMEAQGVTVPEWLQGETVPACPWHSRDAFLASLNSDKMRELRQFLVDTIPIQAQFMVHRMVNAFPKLISNANYEDRIYIFDQFTTLSSTPQGLYALVDYVNFKGEGTGIVAQRKNRWGLFQVLQGMKNAPYQYNTLQSFVWAANQVLTERVRNAPYGSHDEKWLPGWRKRLCTYLEAA